MKGWKTIVFAIGTILVGLITWLTADDGPLTILKDSLGMNTMSFAGLLLTIKGIIDFILRFVTTGPVFTKE